MPDMLQAVSIRNFVDKTFAHPFRLVTLKTLMFCMTATVMFSGEKPVACGVEGCSARFRDKVQLRRHLKHSHTDGSLMRCPRLTCDFSTANGTHMLRHLMTHSDV